MNRRILITEEQVYNLSLCEELLMEASMTLPEIHEKYYSMIPEETFERITKGDPTWNEGKPLKMGNYSRWMLNNYRDGKFNDSIINQVLGLIDDFHKYRNLIQNKDLNSYKSLNDIARAVNDAREVSEDELGGATSKQMVAQQEKMNGAKKVYEDGEWIVIVPETEEAAKFYGKGTKWCTSAEKDNRFEQYNKEGKLYINIRKSDGKKFQFQLESESFMDEEDKALDKTRLKDVIGMSDGLVDFYKKINKDLFSYYVFTSDVKTINCQYKYEVHKRAFYRDGEKINVPAYGAKTIIIRDKYFFTVDETSQEFDLSTETHDNEEDFYSLFFGKVKMNDLYDMVVSNMKSKYYGSILGIDNINFFGENAEKIVVRFSLNFQDDQTIVKELQTKDI